MKRNGRRRKSRKKKWNGVSRMGLITDGVYTVILCDGEECESYFVACDMSLSKAIKNALVDGFRRSMRGDKETWRCRLCNNSRPLFTFPHPDKTQDED